MQWSQSMKTSPGNCNLLWPFKKEIVISYILTIFMFFRQTIDVNISFFFPLSCYSYRVYTIFSFF